MEGVEFLEGDVGLDKALGWMRVPNGRRNDTWHLEAAKKRMLKGIDQKQSK